VTTILQRHARTLRLNADRIESGVQANDRKRKERLRMYWTRELIRDLRAEAEQAEREARILEND
jgi:hypothetical protein